VTITRPPLPRESARCSARPRHTFTLKNEVSPSRQVPSCWNRWVTATRRLVGLKAKRVDLLNGRVTVAEQVAEVNGQLIPGPPKTAAGRRTITLPAVAAVALADHLAEYAEPGPEGLVFPAPKGGYVRRSNFRRHWWVPATRTAGVEGLRFHDLRHPPPPSPWPRVPTPGS
jgi:hypothetical protein